MNSINPHRIAGQATAAHEIVADLGDAPDVLALPVGNAGTSAPIGAVSMMPLQVVLRSGDHA